VSTLLRSTRRAAAVEELRKLPAFFRRDLLVMWSYRLAFFTDWLNLLMQVVVFFFVGRIVDPGRLPIYAGTRATYMEFVVIGIAVTSFMQISLGRVVTAIRAEQLQGTLEALLLTPTASATLQLGSVVYELAYVPVRMIIFLALATGIFGVSFTYSGLLPALAVLVVFIPFVWGLGVLSAAGVLTFRRGIGAVGFGATILTLSSGTYFPLSVFPGWVRSLAGLNPITLAVQATREALIGGAGWAETWPTVLVLIPVGAVSMAIGLAAFRLALARERRRGTLGLY
jgi:ABC-2 type transport system permease protein